MPSNQTNDQCRSVAGDGLRRCPFAARGELVLPQRGERRYCASHLRVHRWAGEVRWDRRA